MIADTLSQGEIVTLKNAWVQAVNALAETVEHWASSQPGWSVERQFKEVLEPPLGAYTVPILNIDTPKGRVVLEPMGRNTLRGEGRVELSAYPSAYRVHLLGRQNGSEWVIRTDSGLSWPFPWGEETFLALVNGLLEAE